jgi:hypothetical protein
MKIDKLSFCGDADAEVLTLRIDAYTESREQVIGALRTALGEFRVIDEGENHIEITKDWDSQHVMEEDMIDALIKAGFKPGEKLHLTYGDGDVAWSGTKA